MAQLRFGFAMEQSGLFIKGHPLTYGLIALLAAFGIITVIINHGKYKNLALSVEEKLPPSAFAKVSSFIMLAACVLSAGATIKQLMETELTIPGFLSILTYIAAAIYFFSSALFFGDGKVSSAFSGIALMPVFAASVATVINYTSTTQMSTPAQYGFIIIAQLANVLFFFYFAKAMTGASCVSRAIIISAFSVVANAAAFVSPAIFGIVSGAPDVIWILENSFGIFMTVYTFAVLMFLLKSVREKHVRLVPEKDKDKGRNTKKALDSGSEE